MTAIDFAAFVDELAAVAGEALRPFFRTTLGVENKSISGGFDPVTAADRENKKTISTINKRKIQKHNNVKKKIKAKRQNTEKI